MIFTVDLDVYEARGDDAVLTVHSPVSVALLVKEQLLWVQDLPVTNPKVLSVETHMETQSSGDIF